MYRIPLYRPSIRDRERSIVGECIESTWISSRGSYIEDFEERFSSRIGVNYSISVNNGTAALHIALLTLGIGMGDEVIVPSLTYVASVNAVTYTGARPVFVDVDPLSWCIDVTKIEEALSERTRAVILVHLYGVPCNIDYVMQLAERYKLFVVEDCAEAFGTIYKGKHVGTACTVSTFSFFGNKTITTGEGGMVASNSPDVSSLARKLKSQGVVAEREYWHDIVGYNYRMTNICAALGVAQLERADEILLRKREIAGLYQDEFSKLPLLGQSIDTDCVSSHWLCSFLTPTEIIRDRLRLFLRDNGIETRPLFPPVHLMPIYNHSENLLLNTVNLSKRGLSFPSWPDLKNYEVHLIIELVKRFFKS